MEKKIWTTYSFIVLSLICAIWKEINIVVYEDEIFSPNRLKTSFISALIFWAGIIANVDCFIVRILLYVLQALWLCFLRVVVTCILPIYLGVFQALPFFWLYIAQFAYKKTTKKKMEHNISDHP